MNDKKETCRLCNGQADYCFTLRNMGRYDIKYFVCSACGSMQTEKPYWLDEAYANAIRYTDTYVGERSQRMPRLAYCLAKLFKLPQTASILDWGGGNGLMTRLLRDLGFDARNYDMYDKNSYAGGFDDEAGKNYDMITSFEVLEHMAEPKDEIAQIFERNPKVIFMSTCFFCGEDINWSYLAPYSGRHIFFYSPKALLEIASSRGYSAILFNNLIVYYKEPISKWTKKMIRFCLSERGQWWINLWLAIRPPKGLMGEDWQTMREKVGDTCRH